MLVWLSLGATCLLSAKIAEEQNVVRKLKIHHQKKVKSKSLAKEPNSKVPHLALPLGLGSEGHHATLPKLSDSRLSYPC